MTWLTKMLLPDFNREILERDYDCDFDRFIQLLVDGWAIRDALRETSRYGKLNTAVNGAKTYVSARLEFQGTVREFAQRFHWSLSEQNSVRSFLGSSRVPNGGSIDIAYELFVDHHVQGIPGNLHAACKALKANYMVARRLVLAGHTAEDALDLCRRGVEGQIDLLGNKQEL